MPKNFRSIVFLLILFAIALFLIGFRLGKNIERMDKSFIPTPPISLIPPISPSPLKLNLKTLSHPDCGISFLYPSDLKKVTATDEARLKNEAQEIYFSCDREKGAEFKDAIKDATAEATVTIKNQKISIYKKDFTSMGWSIYNSLNAKTVIFEASENLVDLILQTLEFQN